MELAFFTVPLQPPALARGAGTLAQQGHIETGRARRIARQGLRGRSRHLPSRARRAGRWRRIHAQQQQRHARLLRRQRKAAARRQIQLAHGPPAFHHHRPQRRAAQAIDCRAQQPHRIAHHADQPAVGRAAQLGPARTLKHAHHAHRPPRTQPEQGPFPAHPHRGAQRETRRCRRIAQLSRIDFMHTAMSQPAAQRGVHRRHAAAPPG